MREKSVITAAAASEPAATGMQEMAVLLVTRGMVLALSVVAQSLLAYALLPEGRGAYAVCVLFGDLAGVIFTLGTARGAQYFVIAKRISVSQGIAAAFAFALIGSAAAVAVAIPLIHSGLSFFRNADTGSFYMALLLIPASAFAYATMLQLEGLRRFGWLAVCSLLRAAVLVTAIVALVWVADWGVNGAVLALALGHLAMIWGGVTELRRHCGLAPEIPSGDGLRQTLRYGLKEYPAKVGQSLEQRIGGLLLGIVAGRAEIGLFTVSNTLMTRFHIISAAVSTYLLPRVAGNDTGKPELAAFCARVTWWTVGGLMLIWVAVSGPLVPLLLSEPFTPVTRLSRIMSIGIAAYAGAEIFAAYFRGTNSPQVFSYAMWLSLGVNVALFFGFYYQWGLSGAAWALTGGLLCRSLMLWVMFQRATGLPVSATLLLRRSDVAYLWSASLMVARRAAAR